MSNEYTDHEWDTRQENKYLIEKYPFLMIKDNGVCPWVPTDTYMYTWLDDIPDGWKIAFGTKMCDELLEALGDYADKWTILQVKEKFGQLVIYHSGASDDIYNKVEDVIRKYEDISAHTCIVCGSDATMRNNNWILPWCDACYEKGK